MTEWRPIPSLPGYQASDEGEIRRLPYRDSLGRAAGGLTLARTPNARGYLTVNPFVPARNRYQPCLVHRLVCEAFHGPPPFAGAKALHWVNDLARNTPDNVRWGSQAQNMWDKQVDGTQTRGETHGPSRLNDAAVRIIRRSSLSDKELAEQFDVHPATIGYVRRGQTWQHVE